MSPRERARAERRYNRVLLDAAMLLALPVAIVLGAGMLAGYLALEREVDQRIADRVLVTQRIDRDASIQCHRVSKLRNGLVKILTRIRDTPRESTEAQRAAVEFYNTAIADLPDADCPPTSGRPAG